jgi:prepilin-type N-terminal cleavage/methylation domain-containing protein
MKKKYLKKNKGFTVIEMMIAIAVFFVVITYGMTSLLNAGLVFKQSEALSSDMDNLSFILDDISRNLRTGYNYHCIVGNAFTSLNTALSCPTGGSGLAFEPSTGNPANSDQWVYYIDNSGRLWKAVAGPYTTQGVPPYVQLTPDEVVLNTTASGFYVIGTGPTDTQQPFVVMRLVGTITTINNNSVPFSLETAVSQRLVDR